MILGILVLNFFTTFGVLKDEKVIYQFSLKSDPQKTPAEFALMVEQFLGWSNIHKEDLERAVIASVVPPLTKKIENMCLDILSIPVLNVAPGIKTGLSLRVDNPRELGAELITLSVGALRAYGSPLIVINCGTASTLSIINENKEYIGAVIGPGLYTSLDALFEKASMIPEVSLLPPKSSIGKNTEEALRAGFIYGFAGLIDNLVKKIKEEYPLPFKIIASGDWSVIVKGLSKEINIIDHDLGLKGLYEIHKLNPCE